MTETLDIDLLLGEYGGDYHKALTYLLGRVEAKPEISSRTSAAARKAALSAAIDTEDATVLADLRQKLTSVLDLITSNRLLCDGIMSHEQVVATMREYLDEKVLTDLLGARRDRIRDAVFAHLNEVGEREGYPEPEHHNGTIDVPELGKKFCREGTGRGAPALDEARFAAALGEERFAALCDVTMIPEQVIPAHIERKLNPERVLELARQDPGLLEILRESLVPGDYKTPRFTVRNA